MRLDFSEYRITTFIGLVIFLVVTHMFISYSFNFRTTLGSINSNVAGIREGNSIVNIYFLTQEREGIGYFAELFPDREEFQKGVVDSSHILQREITQLAPNPLSEEFLSVLNHKNESPDYQKLFQLLTNSIIEIVDEQKQIAEDDHNINSMLYVIFHHIPELSEIVGTLSKYGTKEIISKDGTSHQILEIYIERLNRVKYSIKEHMSKLSPLYQAHIYALYNDLESKIEQIEYRTLHIIDGSEEIDYNRYLLEISRAVESAKSLVFMSASTLEDRLLEREKSLKEEFLYKVALFVVMILLIIYTIYRMVLQMILYKNENRLILYRDKFIKDITERVSKASTSQEVARDGLTAIAERFGSINALLYICSKKNRKMYLGATYGVLPSDVKNSIEPSEGLIGEIVYDIDVREVHKAIPAGVLNINSNYLVTAPLRYTDQLIGVLQFSTTNKDEPTKRELKLLKDTLNILSSYLFKLQNEEEQSRYLKLVDNHVITSSTNVDGIISSVSQAFIDISGYSKHELIGHDHNIVRHKDMSDEMFREMWSVISEGDIWTGEIKNKKKNGDFYWVKVTISPDFDFFNNIIGYTAIRQDITDRKKIEEISVRDGLTNLYNRRHFDDMLPRQINIGRRNQTLLVFMLMDIDNFKKYNDRYGHQAGDIALQKVATTLQKTFNRSDDYVFRLGGEEFAVLLFADSESIGRHLANRLRQRVSSLEIEHKGNDNKGVLTVSIGIYYKYGDDPITIDEMYKEVDTALYKAKEGGRDKVVEANGHNGK